MTQQTVESSPEIVIALNDKKPIRVLHVDDEPSILKIAKQCLELQGPFQVDTASSVEEAFEKMKEETYDAVVSDYLMPGKDGLEFLKELRQSGHTVPFLIFTGKGREEVAIKALNLGADQYLNKTGDPETVYCELGYAIRRTVERRKAETALETLGERYRRLFESAVEGVVINGSDGKILSLNRAAANILGYDNPEELIGRRAVELYADPTARARLLEELVEKGCVKDRELAWKKKDGALIEILASIAVQKDEKGKLLQTEGIIRDVTEKKKVEKALKESEEKYKTLVEQSLQGIIVAQGSPPHLVFANAAMSKILGYTPKEMISFSPKQTLEIVHPDDRELFFSRFKDRLEGKSPPSNYVVRGVRKDRTIVWLELSSSRIEYDGRPAVQAMFMDITQRKKAEDELRESEEKFRTLFNEAMDAVFVADAETGILIDCNQAAMELVGRTEQELIGKHQRILHPETEAKNAGFSNTFQQHIGEREGQVLKTQVITKNGEIKEVAIKGSIIELRGRKILQGIFRNISEHREALEELKESEERFRELFESIQDPVGIFVGREGRLIDYNTAYKKSSGYTDEELKGKVFLDFVHPDDHAMVLEKYRTKYSEEKLPLVYEIRGMNKKGEVNPLEISVSTYKRKGRVIGIEVIHRDITDRKKAERAILENQENFKALFAGNPEAAVHVGPDFSILDVNPRFQMLFGYKLDEIKGRNLNDVVVPKDKIDEAQMLDCRAEQDKHVSHATVRRKKDGSLVPVFVSAASITVGGRFLGYVAVYKDISELKNTQKKLEIMNEKLRVTGGLTRHDVRNKLSAIKGNAYLLKKQLAGDGSALDKLKDMDAAVEQAVRIFDFAKTYEMLGVEELVYVGLEKTVDEAISLFSGLKGVTVTNDCVGLSVLADSLLRQLFYDLIDNSLKYGEKITQIRIRYEKTPDNQLKLIYEDDGMGISEDARQKLFTEGFTTGKGSGYGLYLIKKMVEVYGWTIQETGEPSKGARFIMTIPHMNQSGKENYRLH
ncbi:MAG TPA: PAS domain S-box protein [candidate division Zixibacteria bacterium]|nr:PAS domain S-box protein [candidate division Zixibacteria bacterium]